jgi:hypothetical protein
MFGGGGGGTKDMTYLQARIPNQANKEEPVSACIRSMFIYTSQVRIIRMLRF